MVNSAKATENGAANQASAHPLFFTDPRILDSKRHATAGIRKKSDFSFAKNAVSLPVTMHELVDAAKYYPIVFSPDQTPLLLAVTGLRRENIFIDDNNKWEKHAYIPAYVRKYPFAVLEDKENDKLALCVDEASDHFMAEEGDQRFFDGEEGTELARNALLMCGEFQKQLDVTKKFAEAIAEHKLLSPKEMELTLTNDEDAEKLKLHGFQLVEEKPLTDLPDDIIVQWHKTGWLALLGLINASQTNWRGLINRHRIKEGIE